MPKLRDNVKRPRRRKLEEAMRPGESRAVTIVGLLLTITITIAGAAFLLRILYPGRTTTPWVVLGALVGVFVFVAVLLRAVRIGTDDRPGPD